MEKKGFFSKKSLKTHFFRLKKIFMVIRSFRFFTCYGNNHYDNQVQNVEKSPTSHVKK